MAGAIAIRTDYMAEALRASGLSCMGRKCCTAPFVSGCGARRPQPGRSGTNGVMDRQTLRDCVHRFNAAGSDGLRDQWRSGSACRLTADQLTELSTMIAAGPDHNRDGMVRWRRVDLKWVIEERFGVS